ncbi:MAG: prolyl oligopeptidase family serine peptidase [Planctomycetota bacterium]
MTPLRFFVCCLGVAVLIPALRALGDEPLPPGWSEHAIPHDGEERWYRVYEPADLPVDAAVVVVLHGGMGSMRKIGRPDSPGTGAWPDLCAREGALLVVPNAMARQGVASDGDRQNWNDIREDGPGSKADDVGFLETLVGHVHAKYETDPARTFVTGGSNGGMMTFRVLVERPGLFAAGAAFVATLPEESRHVAVPEAPTPLMICNGTDDPLIKWDGGPILPGSSDQRSTAETVAWWVDANRAWADLAEVTPLADVDHDDGCRITLTKYPAGAGGAPVWLYEVTGGGHCMPSAEFRVRDGFLMRRMIGTQCRDAEGVELAWAFFERATAIE